MSEPTKFVGLDEAIVGFAIVWQRHPDGGAERVETLIYDGDRIAHFLVEKEGMDPEDAHEFLEFNISGAYLGPDTPIIVWPYDPEVEES